MNHTERFLINLRMGCRYQAAFGAMVLVHLCSLVVYLLFQLSVTSRKIVLNTFGEDYSGLHTKSKIESIPFQVHVNNSSTSHLKPYKNVFGKITEKKLKSVDKQSRSVTLKRNPHYVNSSRSGQILNVSTLLKENHSGSGQNARNVATAIKVNTTATKKLENHFLMCSDPFGRLGNLMFEFATSFGIADQLNYIHVIRSTHPLLKYFQINSKVFQGKLTNVLTIRLENKHWNINNSYLSHNLTFVGHYQSWKCFENVSKEVRRELTIKSNFVNQAAKFLASKTPYVKTLIGIHVRRGDFLANSKIKRGRVVADQAYINKSTEFFRKRYKDAFFVVVSDDKLWCKQNIKGNDVVISNFKEPILDMAIMSLCNHTIITAGTFSWWAGWLSGGTVIYLKDFPRPGSALDRNSIVREEYYLPEWIGMSNG